MMNFNQIKALLVLCCITGNLSYSRLVPDATFAIENNSVTN